jgi:hypothetical protein
MPKLDPLKSCRDSPLFEIGRRVQDDCGARRNSHGESPGELGAVTGGGGGTGSGTGRAAASLEKVYKPKPKPPINVW